MKAVIRILSSLRLAVVLLIGITASLAAGTFLESLYDTRTAKFWVYDAIWFHALLALLGTLILTVALTRVPWKKRHIPFLLAHLGIILLLVGSWVTKRFGVDASMPVTEGESSSTIEMGDPVLAVFDGKEGRIVEIPWVPPGVDFPGVDLPEYRLRIDRFLTHAEPSVRFVPPPAGSGGPGGRRPAIKLRLEGGPLPAAQELWLWAGEPEWRVVQLGPAWFTIAAEGAKGTGHGDEVKPRLELVLKKSGALSYRALSRSGSTRQGELPPGGIAGSIIEPGWMGMKVRIREWVPDAVNDTRYTPARIQYGDQAPPSAIRLVAGRDGQESELWLGIGDEAVLTLSDGRQARISYRNRYLTLPFSLRLERFKIDHYPGTANPMEFSSNVTVIGDAAPEGQIRISMNQPLQHAGYTLYQASYIPADPRPVISVFSVNRDPGRWLKYGGSLLIVAGCVLLFAAKYQRKAHLAAAASQSPGMGRSA